MISHKVYRSEGEDRRWLVLMFEKNYLKFSSWGQSLKRQSAKGNDGVYNRMNIMIDCEI